MYPVTYERATPFHFNENVDASGNVVVGHVQDAVVIDRLRYTPTFRSTLDPLHLGLGATLGRAHKGVLYIQLAGRILVPDTAQRPTFGDRRRAMMSAFDPYLCALASPDTEGAFGLAYTEETADTGVFPSGLMALRRYCRPVAAPTIDEIISQRGSAPWSLGLACADPRAYAQTALALALTPASPSGNLTNDGTSQGPVKVTIVMSGSGASNFTLTVAGVDFILDLGSVTTGDQIIVIGENCAPFGSMGVTKNANPALSLKTSGPASWPVLPVGTSAITITNTAGVASVAVSSYATWA